MKKVKLKTTILIITFILLLSSFSVTYGTYTNLEEEPISVYSTYTGGVSSSSDGTIYMYRGIDISSVIGVLENNYGIEVDVSLLETKMQGSATIEIKKIKAKKGTYNIKIGNKTIKDLSYETLKSYGCTCEESEIEVGTSWDVILVLECTFEHISEITGGEKVIMALNGYDYKIAVFIIGIQFDELTDDDQEDIDEALDDSEDLSQYDQNSTAEDWAEWGQIVNWAEKFLSNPQGTISNLVFDIIRTVADAIQIAINFVQTVPLGTAGDWDLMYDYEDLVADSEGTYSSNGATNRDAYTNVSNTYSEEQNDGEYHIEVEDTDSDNYMFEETRIPIVCVDLYNMATGNIFVLDINFLTGNETNTSTFWNFLRNIVVAIIRASLYISAAILITALIWHGLGIVTNSLTNPRKKAEHQQKIEEFARSIIMLIGTVVIMAVSIFSYQIALGDIQTSGDSIYEQPIRVHFKKTTTEMFGLTTEETEYSFSTNITGYVRFMAEIENPDRYKEKAVYVLVYLILVIVNAMILIVMFFRMLILWVLSIAGPLIAAAYAITGKDSIKIVYNKWMLYYIGLAMMQLIFAIIYRIILELM